MNFLANFFHIDHFQEEKYVILYWLNLLFAICFNFYFTVLTLPSVIPVECDLSGAVCKLYSDFFLLNAFSNIPNIHNFSLLLPFLLISTSAYFFLHKDFTKSLLFFAVFWLTGLLPYFIGFMSFHDLVNFPGYLTLFVTFIFLFAGKSRWPALQIFFVMFFLFSVPAKIFSDTWILGQFSLLHLVPYNLQFIFTNTLILLQIFLPIFLTSEDSGRRYIAVAFFEIFHFYSILIVKWKFAIICMPMLYLLFVYGWEKINIETLKKNLIIVSFFITLSFLNLIRFFIPGNDFYTFEGSMYAFSMFQGEYVCNVDISRGGNVQHYEKKWHECDPRRIIFEAKKSCSDAEDLVILNLNIILPHQNINTISNTNVCSLDYGLFSKNEYIRPNVENTELDKLDKWRKILFLNKDILSSGYFLVFFIMFLIIIHKIVKSR